MPSMIDDLKNPASLPDRTEEVSVVQTHISIVFVADKFVYKVKKPVNFGFLDFSTLEKRYHFCRQEVRLNRRLSEDLYIGVVPITFDGKKYTMRQGTGEVVEYAVKMKRFPEDRLMKSLFERGALTIEHLDKIALHLARFHAGALRSHEIDQFGKPERFRVNTDENFAQVEKYITITIERKNFDALRKWTDAFYAANRDTFIERIKAGRIRDCHGDLHMEHVCFTEGLSIIDCIEFNDRFRYSDTVADIAFLLMDLEYHGEKRFSELLWDRYKGLAGEGDVDALLTFYKVYRAFVRGKVNSFQLDDDSIGPERKEMAVQTAIRYFKLAHSYLEKP
ncbi:MAG: phosphotransferase [Thermodesulfobacteriota bacterium]|nr:phosphotransferase [Thermodesulfobacteriota bacterium]